MRYICRGAKCFGSIRERGGRRRRKEKEGVRMERGLEIGERGSSEKEEDRVKRQRYGDFHELNIWKQGSKVI